MIKFEIIYENKEFLVINKPAGLIAHGAPHIKETSLAEQLLDDYPELAKIGDDPARPGLMHRLDKLASGLMVIAKTQASFDNLKSQFQKRTVEKRYAALVFGQISRDDGIIDFPIARSAKGFRMAAIPKTVKGELNESGRTAKTEFTVIKKYINYSFLEVKIITGRTHQIRVHLSAYGHPLVGDDKYATRKTKTLNQKLSPYLQTEAAENRIFLVAQKLSFDDMNGDRQSFSILLPDNLQRLLENIK